MKNKYEFNIDYLKICYRQPKGLFQKIAAAEGDIIYRFDYDLKIIERDKERIMDHAQTPVFRHRYSEA